LSTIEEVSPCKTISFSNSNPNFQFQIRRNITVSVLEARDLIVTDRRKNLETYVAVLINDIKKAKTTIKSGTEPFWREEFKFNNISLCAKRIQIIIFNHQKIQKDTEIGVAVIYFKDLVNKQKFEKWYEFKFLHDDKQNENQNLGYIRVATQLNNKYFSDTKSSFIIQPSKSCMKILLIVILVSMDVLLNP